MFNLLATQSGSAGSYILFLFIGIPLLIAPIALVVCLCIYLIRKSKK